MRKLLQNKRGHIIQLCFHLQVSSGNQFPSVLSDPRLQLQKTRVGRRIVLKQFPGTKNNDRQKHYVDWNSRFDTCIRFNHVQPVQLESNPNSINFAGEWIICCFSWTILWDSTSTIAIGPFPISQPSPWCYHPTVWSRGTRRMGTSWHHGQNNIWSTNPGMYCRIMGMYVMVISKVHNQLYDINMILMMIYGLWSSS